MAPGIGWQDLRTVGECLGWQGEGLRLAPNLSATKVCHLLDQHDPDRTRDLCFGTVDSWIIWHLTGGAAHVTDASNAALTGLVNRGGTHWDPKVLSLLRIPESVLPTIVDSSGQVAEASALDTNGMVSEGSGQNVFAIEGKTIYTPPIDGTLLPGITRDTVLTLAAELDLKVMVQPLSREVLYTCDELFVCGTASEITPVRSVDRLPVGDGKVGPVTRALQTRFLDIVNGRAPDAYGWLTAVR